MKKTKTTVTQSAFRRKLTLAGSAYANIVFVLAYLEYSNSCDVYLQAARNARKSIDELIDEL